MMGINVNNIIKFENELLGDLAAEAAENVGMSMGRKFKNIMKNDGAAANDGAHKFGRFLLGRTETPESRIKRLMGKRVRQAEQGWRIRKKAPLTGSVSAKEYRLWRHGFYVQQLKLIALSVQELPAIILKKRPIGRCRWEN